MKPAKNWRAQPQRYRLCAGKCDKCGKLLFPPRQTCPECRGKSFTEHALKDTGRIVTYTVQHVAGSAFADQTPFAVGIVETDDGARLTVQIVDFPLDQLRSGEKVRLVFRKVREDGEAGVIAYAHKAAPLQS